MTNNEFTKLASELETCGKTLICIAEAMRVLPDEKASEPSKQESDQQALTLEDVRKVAADKSRQGFTKEVRALIQKHGANNLSGVDATQYSALLKELEVLNHAE